MKTWGVAFGWPAAALALLTAMSAEVAAQPAGTIDPLYEHRCNKVVDINFAKADKDTLRERLIQIDHFYARSVELARSGDAQAALRDMLAFKQQIAALVAPTHHVYVDMQLRLAALWAELREYDRAFEEIDSALRVWQNCLGPDAAFTLQALSMKSQLLERVGQASAALKIAEDILEREQRRRAALTPDQVNGSAEQKRFMVLIANVAALAYRVGDYPRAKAGAQQTVEAASRLTEDDMERHELLSSAWYCLNRIAYFTRDADGQQRSIRGLEESYLAMRSKLGQEHRRTLPLLANLGFAVADVDPKQAVRILGDYVAMVEAERIRAPLPEDRRILLEGRAGTYQRFAFAAHEAARTEEAFWGMEWFKARSLRDSVSVKLALADMAMSPQDRATLQASETRIAELETLVEVQQTNKAIRDTATLALLEEKKRYERVFVATEGRSPSLRLASLSKIQRPENAATVLKPDEVFISYLTRRSNGPMMEVLIAVLEPNSRLSMFGPVEVYGLETSITSYVEILSTAGGLNRVATFGRELWRNGDMFYFAAAAKEQPKEAKSIFAVDPLRAMLSAKLLPDAVRSVISKYKRWTISPASALWNLPFEALSDDGQNLVLDERIVRYAHSWSMQTYLSERTKTRVPKAPLSLLVIGGATYSDRVIPQGTADGSFPKWSDLTFSAKELDQVATMHSLVEGETIFRGSRATTQTVASLESSGNLSRADLILFSSHGYLNVVNPAASAIVLGRPSGGTEADRYLSARAISRLNLSANVVVVSSCDSGRGRVASGEGVLGLPYAFFSAGASSTILTLWKVYDDEATANLVSKLMAGLRDGQPADEALTAAKRFVRKSSGEASWAPFVLVGR